MVTQYQQDFRKKIVQCPGDRNHTCGGHWRMNVYTTGMNQDVVASEYLYDIKGCVTIKATANASASGLCNNNMNSNDWCNSYQPRKKRQATCPVCSITIYDLWYCPRSVRTRDNLNSLPQCCLHSFVRSRIRGSWQRCCSMGICV